MRPETEAWVEDAQYDLQSAKVMLDSGRYFVVVFMCHPTIEKLFGTARCCQVRDRALAPKESSTLSSLRPSETGIGTRSARLRPR